MRVLAPHSLCSARITATGTIVLALALAGIGCRDVVAPVPANPPSNVIASLAAPTTVQLRWDPRPVNEYISSYVVYRNGIRIAESKDTAYADSSLVESATFSYAVSSKTGAGEESAQSSTVSVTTRDATPPRIIQNFPVNGAGPLPVEGIVVTFLFSEAMDSATVNTSNVTLKVTSTEEPIPGRISYLKSQQYAEFRANNTMPPATSITVTAGTGLKDMAGNNLSAPYSFAFTTTENVRPRILATDPVNGAKDVSLSPTLRIMFSERMKESTLFDIRFADNLTGYIPSRGSYDTLTNVYTFTSAERLRSKHGYSVGIGMNFPITDLAGNRLPPSSFSFTTLDASPPTVIAFSPPDSATGVDVTTPVMVTFSEPMDPATINATTLLVYGWNGGPSVSGTISYDPATMIATFIPSAPLVSGTRYAIYVIPNMKDATGVQMEVPFFVSFTTR
jgi:hypothetical protein